MYANIRLMVSLNFLNVFLRCAYYENYVQLFFLYNKIFKLYSWCIFMVPNFIILAIW